MFDQFAKNDFKFMIFISSNNLLIAKDKIRNLFGIDF